jgi:hypothetical protein
MPFQCPECMPAYWKKRVKRERIMCLTPIIVVIALMLSFIVYDIYYYDYYDDPYSDIYVSEEDILPIVHEETYNSVTNEVDITYKIYVTNSGDKHSEEVFIELYLLKNSTVRYEATSSKAVVKAEETEIFELRTTIKLHYYDIQLKIWDGKMVVQEGRKQVQVNRGDIQDLSEFDGFYTGGKAMDEGGAEKESAELGGASNIIILLLVIALPIILIIGFLLYKERTKMPNLGPPGGAHQPHGAYPPPPQPPVQPPR